MADPRILLATAIDDSAEALYRIVADIPDPVAKARAALSAVDQIKGHLLPDLVSIRRAAIREARQRMSAQELADRLGMSRSRVYAVLTSADNVTGPLTVQYRTAAGGVGEAPVAWTVEPLRGTRRIRVTRDEIRYRRTEPPVTVVVPADSVEVESAPHDSRLDGAFRSLENQAAHALSQADLAAQHAPDGHPITAPIGAGWRFQADGEPSPRWPRTRYVAVRSWWGLQDN
ncbi:MAG TPA: helix-turn-helix domain-containing protein [Nakamurella sp.]